MGFTKKIVLLYFAYLFLSTFNVSYATPSCGGSVSCYPTYDICSPDGCDPSLPGCSCTAVCDGGAGGAQSFSCSSFGASCTDSSFGVTFCNTGCAGFGGGGAMVSFGCFLNPDACQVAGDCGSNQTCCGGTPNYCSNTCYDCAGNYICGVTPAPTSPPVGGCTPGDWCGSACLSACHTSDLYCSAGGTCTVQVGDYVGDWCGCPPAGGGTSTPAPTPPGGGGACGSGFLCGTVCCAAGDTCVAPGAGGSCLPPSGGGGGCVFGSMGGVCLGNTCTTQCTIISSCSVDLDCTCGNNVCDAGETAVNCPADCTYDVSGVVFVDSGSGTAANDGDGNQDCSGACNNGAGDELNYNGATVGLNPGGLTDITSGGNSGGDFDFLSQAPGNKTLTLTVPSGYVATTTNPISFNLSNNTNRTFGIELGAPVCVPGSISLNPSGGTANPGDRVTLSVTSCTNVENPDDGSPPPPFSWNPDTGGNNPPPTVGVSTDTPTSSTTTWTAPACPAVQTTYTPRVTVGGSGGTTNYNTSITVPATVGITANVLSVTSIGACGAGAGPAYSSGGVGATLNLTNGGTINQNQVTNGGTGATTFTCLPNGNYQLSLQVPSGYDVVGTSVAPAVESPIGSNGLSFATGGVSQTAYFCIAPIDPWFQTSQGDVRFLNLSNPVPTNQYASSDATYPGIFYSSDSNADLGVGSASVRNWVINNEYSYNADTENRNGGMSYDFYKSKVLQDGVTVTPISAGTFDQSQITASGVFESPADLTINLYNHVNGRRVVLLVNGNVTINASAISIPQNQGILIVAAKGNITIGRTIGTATLNSTTSSIDGYYTAQGRIVLDGDACSDGTTPDLRLNVGGALIANSLKPFSSTGTGTIQNNRSLCTNNLLYPSLYIGSRPDFLTQLTDFYKISYTKWQEVNP